VAGQVGEAYVLGCPAEILFPVSGRFNLARRSHLAVPTLSWQAVVGIRYVPFGRKALTQDQLRGDRQPNASPRYGSGGWQLSLLPIDIRGSGPMVVRFQTLLEREIACARKAPAMR
jgi:hypothetical protein